MSATEFYGGLVKGELARNRSREVAGEDVRGNRERDRKDAAKEYLYNKAYMGLDALISKLIESEENKVLGLTREDIRKILQKEGPC